MADDVPAAVRPLGEEDVEALWRLRGRALRDRPDAFLTSPADHPPLDEYRARFLERAEGGSVVLGAFAETGLVGMAGLAPQRSPKLAHKGTVWGVFVEPGARGRGLGEALVRGVIAAARAAGLARLVLAVSAENPARRVYERCGFVAWGTEPCALELDGRCVDEVWMGLELPPRPMR